MTEQDRGEQTLKFKEVRLAIAKLLAVALILGGVGLVISQLRTLDNSKSDLQQPTPTPVFRIITVDSNIQSALTPQP